MPEYLIADDLPPRTDFDDIYTLEVDQAIRAGLSLLLLSQAEDGSFSKSKAVAMSVFVH